MLPPDSSSSQDTTTRFPSRGLGTFQGDPNTYVEGSVKASVPQELSWDIDISMQPLAMGEVRWRRDIGDAIRESASQETRCLWRASCRCLVYSFPFNFSRFISIGRLFSGTLTDSIIIEGDLISNITEIIASLHTIIV